MGITAGLGPIDSYIVEAAGSPVALPRVPRHCPIDAISVIHQMHCSSGQSSGVAVDVERATADPERVPRRYRLHRRIEDKHRMLKSGC